MESGWPRVSIVAAQSPLRTKLTDKDAEFFANDDAKLARVQQYYRKLDKTMEWVESNYYKLPLEQQTAALIAVNAYLARRRGPRSGQTVPFDQYGRGDAQLPRNAHGAGPLGFAL